jgi:pimeloyl-ACP methyl ester carboxylesterase
VPPAISPGVCDLGNVELHYLEAGVGHLVVCLHGFPDHAPGMIPLLGRLADSGFRAVAPFMRGYAPSTVRAGTYESAALAGDALGVANALAAGEDFSLIGHDVGGHAALHAAILQSDRVRGLVTLGAPHPAVMAGALRDDPHQLRRAWHEFVFLSPGFSERLAGADGCAFLAELVRTWSPIPPMQPEEWRAVTRTLGSRGVMTAALGVFRARHGVAAPDPVLRASAAREHDPVDVDSLVVFGRDDGYVLPSTHRLQGEEHFLRELRVLEVPGAGHWPHRERPDVVLDAIVQFLRRRDRRAAR